MHAVRPASCTHLVGNSEARTNMSGNSSLSQDQANHRAALRKQGLRPVEIWVPDTEAPGFADECARQAAIVGAANEDDCELAEFSDAAGRDLEEHLQELERGTEA